MLGPQDKAAPPTSQQIPSEVSEEPSDSHPFLFLIHPQESSALSQSEAMFIAQGECSQNMLSEAFWTLNIALLQFNEYSQLRSQRKVHPIKN